MSLRIISAVLKSQAGKVADRFRGDKAPLDPAARPAPFDIVIGHRLQLDETPFILMGDQSAVTYPGLDPMVEAISRFPLLGFEGFRFYINGGKQFLQVLTDGQGEIVKGEVKLFQTFDEVNPQSDDEWGFWLAESDGSVGLDCFETMDGVLYHRAWNPGPTRIRPITFRETFDGDTQGSRRIVHESMLYRRGLEQGQSEYMLLSAISAGNEGNWVALSVGIDLDPGYLQVM